MRSARRSPAAPLAVALCGGALLLGGTGCETTQEKAAAHQAEAQRILDAREKRQAQKKRDKSAEKGGAKR